eukprot:g11608.t1
MQGQRRAYLFRCGEPVRLRILVIDYTLQHRRRLITSDEWARTSCTLRVKLDSTFKNVASDVHVWVGRQCLASRGARPPESVPLLQHAGPSTGHSCPGRPLQTPAQGLAKRQTESADEIFKSSARLCRGYTLHRREGNSWG